jgi:hypothetical protein
LLELQVVTFGTIAFVRARCDTSHFMQLPHISERETVEFALYDTLKA